MPTWLITGSSTGLGSALARAVLARGWNAVVTARDPDTAEAIIKAVEAANPPFRLALGRDAVERIRAEMEAQRRGLETWA